jgi:hypothetical protein
MKARKNDLAPEEASGLRFFRARARKENLRAGPLPGLRRRIQHAALILAGRHRVKIYNR